MKTSQTAKHSIMMLSANTFAQIIPFLVYPLLTRLYSAQEFGVLNLFLTIGGVISIFATAEYQYSILLPKSNEKARSCFQMGFLIALVVTLLCFFSVLFSTQIGYLFNAPELVDFYFLLPLFVFLSSFWNLLNYWFTRYKLFKKIGTYQLLQSLFGSVSKYGMGIGGFLNGGLIIATIIGLFSSLFFIISGSYKKYIKPLFLFDWTSCKSVALEYSNFPKYSLPRAVVNYFSGNLPILLLTPFFGLTEIGFFGMGLTLAFRPVNLISNSLYQVFFQRTAEKIRNKNIISPFYKKFIQKILLIVIPSFSGLYFFLPRLISFFLGEKWSMTGEYIQIMLPWLAASLLVAPICYLADIFHKQKMGFILECINLLLIFASLLIGIYLKNFKTAIFLFVLVEVLFISFQLFWFFSMISNYEKTIKDSNL